MKSALFALALALLTGCSNGAVIIITDFIITPAGGRSADAENNNSQQGETR